MQVLDLISLKPFDMAAISDSVRKTRHVIIVEECMKVSYPVFCLDNKCKSTQNPLLINKIW